MSKALTNKVLEKPDDKKLVRCGSEGDRRRQATWSIGPRRSPPKRRHTEDKGEGWRKRMKEAVFTTHFQPPNAIVYHSEDP